MNEVITEEIANAIEELGIESVRIRTVLTCEAKHGVCKKCYGRNLATNSTVEIGEAVGIIAAQSIGQPGTQLTMRTFHIGGAATKVSEENKTAVKYPVLIKAVNGTHVELENKAILFTRKGSVTAAKVLRRIPIEKGMKPVISDGQRVIAAEPVLKHGSKEVLAQDVGYAVIHESELLIVAQDQKIDIRNGAELHVKVGELVEANASIATFDPFTEPIISEVAGIVRFRDVVLGTTLKEEINEDTGNVEKKITEYSLETLQPRFIIEDKQGNEIGNYFLPASAYLNVEDGEKVHKGRILAKLLKESVKTRDITGGLPRVGELFEARKPKSPAVLAQISGLVRMKGIVKGRRLVVIEDAYAKEYKHLIPLQKHLLVRDGDTVAAGEPLCDGAVDPHDILLILGESAVQSFLMNEVQAVYRMQGVSINDKHVGVIIRQMMRKVEVVQVGDTNFIFGQQVDKYKFHEENNRVIREGGQPAVARPLLLGITRASLNIDSFISAASFQETTKVLTNAAIAGSVDNLRGLKENVIIGHLIPAGTGMKTYREVKLYDETSDDLDLSVQNLLEQRKHEAEKRVEPVEFDEEDDGDDIADE